MVQTRGQATPRRSRKKSTGSAAATANGSARKSSAAASETNASSPSTPTPAPRSRKSSTGSTRSVKSAVKEAVDTVAAKATPSSAAKSVSRKSSTRSLSASAKKMLNPKSTHFEFGGPVGAVGVSIATPFFAYLLYFACNEKVGCAVLPRYPDVIAQQMVKGIRDSFFDGHAWAVYLGWYAYCIACWALLPGKWVKGSELRTGKKLDYKLNAFATLVLSLVLSAVYIFNAGAAAYAALFYDHWPGLVTVSIVVSLAQAAYVYIESFKTNKLLAKGGNTGNHVYDWFIGRELNPRIGIFDIKTFNELRPGLILWFLLNISCACHQYVKLRGQITDSMALVVAFEGWYIIDSLFNESAILTQMDITTDGFGFMLAVGDLTWVPFTYGLQARYLAFMPKHLGLIRTLAIIAVNATGYYIFRTANGEKDAFRKGQNPKKLDFITTSSGRKLLTSGWWGLSRHPNYFGDWIMALAWSLPTGLATPLTYFYLAFFVVLLVHRQRRDDIACAEKYGKDWTRYCKIVPSRIIPYVY